MMNDDGSLKDGIEDFFPYRHDTSSIPLENMRAYAEWAGLEKTEHWHSCLGWVMKDGGYFDDAILEFKKALEIDGMAWVAQEGLSRCYAGHDNIKLALEWMAKAIPNVPKDFCYLAQDGMSSQVASWLGQIGDSERAIEAWKGVWENDIQDTDKLEKYICELHKWGRHQDLVVVITETDSLVSRNEHCETLLVQLLASADYEIFNAIGTAINVTNAMDTFEAIALWQQTIGLIDDFAKSSGRVLIHERTWCTNAISQIHFDAAVEA
ncbi:hypothetical protein VE02_07990 [Pseudogymnoascus sp. 03VT05]|nr:hypothetical protein VE02_07990 [Pseudogymnoascus sp. 03VT05]